MARMPLSAATIFAAAILSTGGCSNGSSDDLTQIRQENEQLRVELTDAIAQRDAADLRAREAESRAAQGMSPTAPAEPSPAKPATPAANTYTVRAGDTLSHIALRFYKDAELWPEIHEANMGVIGDNPARLRVGMKLTIPPR